MVAYFNKSDASEGFNQVIDFLNGRYIKYALTINPNIYVSCIKQLWNTVTIKHDNDVTKMQALVDKKNVVVTKAAIREVLLLDDSEGVDCLPNEEIFTELAHIGQEFEEGGDAEEHVQDATNDDVAQGDDTATYGEVSTVSQKPSIPSPTPPTLPPQPPQDLPSTSQGRIIDEMEKDDVVALMDDKEEDKKEEEAKVVEDDQVQGRQAESQAEIYKIDMDHASKVLSMQEDEPAKVQEPQVPTATIIVAPAKVTPTKVAPAPSRKRKGVVIRDSKEESTTSSIIPAKTKSKDKGKGILIEEPKPLKKKQQVEIDEEYARKLHAELNKDIDWDVSIDHSTTNINEAPAQKAAKRRKLNKEVEDLKRHLEIVPDEDDDVYTEATPLARKILVVDYEIIDLNNKPYYKIIRADGTHQLFISFLTLLNNFNREDLEALWNLVKERFSTSKPKNVSDDFLQTTLRAMFKKPDAQAQVWKNQRTIHGQAKVKSWKLLKSCGVHIITFSTTHLILLVERRYPLSRFTLDQMLNAVRLRVEEESEMSLELLRFTRQQHQEGQQE
uniref:Xylulose kinase-1 n=1 Tax=Tanacetum cinerariifolium TaxID=118510 RepID=A0A6L2NPT9_TANCI|nr:hypothetical protein [Tanacetum cinerariifolium]